MEDRGWNWQFLIYLLKLLFPGQIIFGAGRMGIIYAWDLRGGRTSYAFQRSHNEVHHSLLASFKLSEMFEKIPSLKAQSHIDSKEIVSINFNPSCSYQLSFHLKDGWSGVLNTNTLDVTHMHCPPSRENEHSFDIMKKPSWLPNSSIYAVPSHSEIPGLYLLDFHSDPISACHVDFRDDFEDGSVKSDKVAIPAPAAPARNKLVELSEEPLVCTTHPINGTIVAGTELSTLLVISEGFANKEA
ncbi:hypothetical protein ZOSMA_320G00130 [Zostera marina]|uniref:Transducin/WD40 repeat-like superfamily protein n=1 Tax=Zostera marina TaxID=29655 RepID=A0A0K9P8V2_ZOSMR|nr:hypothetical protein ZOSMA_320G00130 [Zostera marina]